MPAHVCFGPSKEALHIPAASNIDCLSAVIDGCSKEACFKVYSSNVPKHCLLVLKHLGLIRCCRSCMCTGRASSGTCASRQGVAFTSTFVVSRHVIGTRICYIGDIDICSSSACTSNNLDDAKGLCVMDECPLEIFASKELVAFAALLKLQ